MTEFALFCIVGLLALTAAVAMLLSDNAVHSALFLIVTMGCIAFLFLLLNAPFLAMIQITVYTGAIMVLFLFVIMLLGSERIQDLDESSVNRRFRWYTPLAWGLVAALLLIVGIVLGQVNLDLRTDTTPAPQLRVLNAAPDIGSVVVTANDVVIASELPFRETSTYVSLPAGEYTITLTPTVGTPLTTSISLQNGTQQTLVEYGDDGLVNVSLMPENNVAVTEGDRSARIAFFNGDTGFSSVRVLTLGSDLNVANGRILVDGLNPGQTSDAVIIPEATVNWAFVDANDPDTVLYRVDNYDVKRDTAGTFVLTQERVFEGSAGGVLRAVALPVVADAAPVYGGPEAIGLELFTNYVLVFQLLAILLLAAMVGAIVLTHRQTVSATRKAIGRRRVSRPLVNVIAAQVGHEVTSGEGDESPNWESRLSRWDNKEPPMQVPTETYVMLSMVLFVLGAMGVLLRRNAILVFMSVELMLNAANLALAAFARHWGQSGGQLFVFFVITVAAAEVAVGLALIVAIFRSKKSINIDDLHQMEG